MAVQEAACAAAPNLAVLEPAVSSKAMGTTLLIYHVASLTPTLYTFLHCHSSSYLAPCAAIFDFMAGPIGRLQAALAAATNEVTVAAANINFDFCLVKYEAPKEYHQLGLNLSSIRKEDAEAGKSHVTARRLAALFAGACPPTPKLISAYGKRVSEIAKIATGSIAKAYSSSIFAAYTGVDATSIWAAATSSNDPNGGAIQIHLLACLLAFMWDASSATSIWVELVKERRQKIARDLENGAALPFSLAAAAAQQEIPRSQLAEWDASARSWIETANNIMNAKQTQLRLILKNIDMPISNNDSVYPSVMEAWRDGLTVMENLISGIPQEVQNGTALLSLSAWNLYPDIHIFGSRPVMVAMKDPLFSPGGILSLGCSPSATTPASGIAWSLSLAHLRHYGRSVRRDARVQEDPSLLSVSEFRQAVLGCLLEIWGISECDQDQGLDTLHRISQTWVKVKRRQYYGAFDFLRHTLEDSLIDKETKLQLIRLGRRRLNFLPSKNGETESGATIRLKPIFGLTDTCLFLSTLESDAARVTYLRRVCSAHPDLEPWDPIIRYNYLTKLSGRGNDRTEEAIANFATAFPISADGSSRRNLRTHTRWISDNKSGESYFGDSHLSGVGETVHLCSDTRFREIAPTSFEVVNDDGTISQYAFFFGDSLLASVFVRCRPADSSFAQLRSPQTPKVEVVDVAWAIEHSLMFDYTHGPRKLSTKFDTANAPLVRALEYLNSVTSVLASIPERIIQAKVLTTPLLEARWIAVVDRDDGKVRHPDPHTLGTPYSIQDQLSILSHFVAGCNLDPKDIPRDAMGISISNSVYVPNLVSGAWFSSNT